MHSESKKHCLKYAELWVSLHGSLGLLLCPQLGYEHGGGIHERIPTVAFGQGMKSGIIYFSSKKKKIISKLLLETVTGSEAFNEGKKKNICYANMSNVSQCFSAFIMKPSY